MNRRRKEEEDEMRKAFKSDTEFDRAITFEKCEFNIEKIVFYNQKHRKKYFLKGGKFMYIVKADIQDVAYSVGGFTVLDSEGSVVPNAELDIVVTSDNPGAVQLTPDPDDQTKGIAHFGAPNTDGSPALSNITVAVNLKDGTMIGSFGAQFTVTPGDPAAISGGSIAFNGLAEV